MPCKEYWEPNHVSGVGSEKPPGDVTFWSTLKEEYLSTRGGGASQGLEAEGSTWILM